MHADKLDERTLCNVHTSAVSDHKEEEPVPINTALLSSLPLPVPLPATLPTAGSLGTANAGMANADLGQFGVTEGAAMGLEPLRWMKAMLNSMMNLNMGGMPNEQEADGCAPVKALGVTYTDKSTQMNVLELDTDTLQVTILSMARSHIYIPLSLLTTTALDCIMLNQSVRYRKVVCRRGVGKSVVDEAYFPAEESL